MDAILRYIPEDLHEWVSKLSSENIAFILTNFGYAIKSESVSSMYTSTNINDKLYTTTSTNIGIIGENEVAEILQEKYTLKNTTKTGKSGDFILLDGNNRILIEVKKYSGTVPSKEIDKFYRDIESNGSINASIFISLTSKIVGINRCIYYTHQYVNGEELPIIFVTLQSLDITNSKLILSTVVDILLVEIESKRKSINVGQKICSAINQLDTNMDFLSNCRLTIHETQTTMNKSFGKIIQQILSAELSIKHAIKEIKYELEEEEIERCNIKDVIDALPFTIENSKIILIETILDNKPIVNLKKNNIIQTTDKLVSVKINKGSVNVIIQKELNQTLTINGKWSYSNKSITIELTENTLQCILNIITSTKK